MPALSAESIHALLFERVPQVGPLQPAQLDPWIPVAPDALLAACACLRDEPALAMDSLMNLGAIDWPARGEGELEVVYHLFSYAHRHGVILKCSVPRMAPELPSVCALWPVADWLEREQFDLLGVRFTGHPELRRLLMPDDWEGHPLRKDYREPASWHGIETTRDNPLEQFVLLDELKKRLAPRPVPAVETPEGSR